MLFWRWKLRRPQRMQSVCVLFRRLPKLPVPFPCEPQQQHHVSGQTNRGVGGGRGGGGGQATMSPAPSGGKRGRVPDPEEDVYVDNLHSHKLYLTEVRSVMGGVRVCPCIP